MFFEGIAYAQTAAAGSNPSQQVFLTTVIPLALLFGIFYFLLIRPQTQKAKAHDRMLKELKRNDEVVTTGGIIGRIHELGEKIATLEVAPNVRVKVDRSQIAALSSFGKPEKK
ncbi:MAG: preprotein translocase subunit YajC [Candidatus Binataceae bacterium]